MIALGLILLVIGLILALAPTGLRPPAVTIGWLLVVAGVVLILLDILDTEEVQAAAIGAVPLSERVRSRLLWWKHDLDRWLDMRALDLARLLPGRLRMWVVVDSANTAIFDLHPRPDGYAGPDGLTFEQMYDGAVRSRARAA